MLEVFLAAWSIRGTQICVNVATVAANHSFGRIVLGFVGFVARADGRKPAVCKTIPIDPQYEIHIYIYIYPHISPYMPLLLLLKPPLYLLSRAWTNHGEDLMLPGRSGIPADQKRYGDVILQPFKNAAVFLSPSR